MTIHGPIIIFFSWGRNQNGQLGLGHNEDSLVPQRVEAFESLAQGCKVKMLAAGAEHTAAVTEDGKLYGWGWGKYGNLGHGDRQDRMLPALVTAVEDEPMKSVACGWRHTIAVAVSGRLYTFGWSKYGQLGHGDYRDHLVPHIVDALTDFIISEAAGGWRHTVGLTSEGKVYAWGWNRFGQIGIGNNIDQCSPQLIQSLADMRVATVCCGWRHTVAITEDGNVFSWGRGTSGQLGHGDLCDRSSPKMIEALSKDGEACETIGKSNHSRIGGAAPWIAPSERYAVVPDESVDQVLLSSICGTYGTVPESDVKRQKTV
ncbi:hypothetical protein CBR_g41650 [Chara braunii]|uniref:RCC1-like domain-containing protein n=1 Tax=Chara braunii TaxID=69332 RepID=A0A388LWE1_CHABU|nr:hypothetical protein CBR_g41650 [Chara braunii]|eukprot:GBG86585.1 hypothetical protein CBR_g41650 [Chara braunii]